MRIRGNHVISGSHGRVYWDGELIMEAESFEAKVTANRETIYLGMDEDSKITGLKGEGTLKLKKVYSRGIKKLLNSWRQGEDTRSILTGVLQDPDTPGKQQERVTLTNVWFNEVTLASFERGAPVEEELGFGFTPSDAEILDSIDVQ